MAYFVTSSVLVAVVCVVVYAILFVGHRGRDYPPGERDTQGEVYL